MSIFLWDSHFERTSESVAFLCKLVMPPSLPGKVWNPFLCFCGGLWAPLGEAEPSPHCVLCTRHRAWPSTGLTVCLLSGTEPELILQDRDVTAGKRQVRSHPSWPLAWRKWMTAWQETLNKTIELPDSSHRFISHPLQLYLFIWAHFILSHISCSSTHTSLSPISSGTVQLCPEGHSEPCVTLTDWCFSPLPLISGTKHRFFYHSLLRFSLWKPP